jgi:hypothetical protein
LGFSFRIGVFALVAVLAAGRVASADPAAERAAEQLRAANQLADELNRPGIDAHPDQRSSRGERVNQAFVALTGEAVNPLFGVTALGIYNYLRAAPADRDSLPLFDQPVIWIPLLAIILLMFFNSTICEAIPVLKIPMNALGNVVNTAGAVAVLPLVVKMFADAFAHPAGQALVAAADTLFPAAHAAGGGVAETMWTTLGWLAGAIIGVVVYAAVWLTFNLVDALILICPFPGIDAMLKSFRLAVVGALAGLNALSPAAAMAVAMAVVLVSLFMAGWSFRLSVFGMVYATDVLFFRWGEVRGPSAPAFTCLTAKKRLGIPVRTYGRLEKNAEGELIFSYRPWLVRPKRTAVLGEPEEFACGLGFINPFLIEADHPEREWLRLPPRFRGYGEDLVRVFGLRQTVTCGKLGSLRNWLAARYRETVADLRT